MNIMITVNQEQAEIILATLIELPFKQVNQLVHQIAKQIEFAQNPKMHAMPTNTVTVAAAQTLNLKHGVKKDGTPKKRPGRPAKKVTK
jgi:hypothetical protein